MAAVQLPTVVPDVDASLANMDGKNLSHWLIKKKMAICDMPIIFSIHDRVTRRQRSPNVQSVFFRFSWRLLNLDGA
jgi:hypothetical protein